MLDPAGNHWYYDFKAEYINPDRNPVQLTMYLARLFEQPDKYTQSYTDAQIDRGLWYIASNGASDFMFVLENESVPVAERLRVVRGIYTLYAEIYAPRCTPHLGHLSESGDSPLNSSCYMWWDLLPYCGFPNDALHNAGLDVLECILTLESDACREAALHGLGHWHSANPQRVKTIIDTYLKQHPNLRAELIAYAQSARAGCVL